jgi:hypothetical protein
MAETQQLDHRMRAPSHDSSAAQPPQEARTALGVALICGEGTRTSSFKRSKQPEQSGGLAVWRPGRLAYLRNSHSSSISNYRASWGRPGARQLELRAYLKVAMLAGSSRR